VTTLATFLAGVLTMGQAVAALFFLRFWRDTRDRLFLFFAGAFALLAADRCMLALLDVHGGAELALYGLRLLAFLLILGAIVDKNVRG
jgi:hypothetical protein